MDRNDFYPKPSIRDWSLLATNILFVAIGVFLFLQGDHEGAIAVTAFFGSCLVFAILSILRKLRFRRATPLNVTIVGGVPIRPSRRRTFGIGVWLAVLGVILIGFGGPIGPLFQIVSGLIALIGFLVLLGVAAGRLPRAGSLQFDPEGLSIQMPRYAYLMQWDNIGGLVGGLLYNVPMLYIGLHRPDLVAVTPPDYEQKVRETLIRKGAASGAHVTLAPQLYGMDLPLLLQAMERYVSDPAARAELAPPPSLTKEPGSGAGT